MNPAESILISRFLPLLALTVALLFASGCKSSTGPGDSNQIPLIPLAVGNEWKYDEMNLDSAGAVMATLHDTVRIIGRDMFDGDPWFVQKNSGSSGSLTYLFNRNDGLYQFHPQWGDKVVRYLHYPVSLNDDNDVEESVLSLDSTYYLVRLHTRINALHKSITVPAGTYDCIEVAIELQGNLPTGPNGVVPPQYEYYAPGVGLIETDWYNKAPDGTNFVDYKEVLTGLHVQ